MTFRHKVGKTTLSGYIAVPQAEEDRLIGAGPDPGSAGTIIRILFDEPLREIQARLYRTSGQAAQLKIAYTGKDGAPFRSWLRQRFPARRVRKPRGVLVLKPLEGQRFQAEAESVRQAEVDRLALSGAHYYHEAKALRFLHPALVDVDECITRIALSAKDRPAHIDQRIQGSLQEAGWSAVESVGAGLLLPGGLRRNSAQLHVVLQAGALYPALMSLAAAWELGECDLGLLLVADGSLTSRLQRAGNGPAAGLRRCLREIDLLSFAIRGPVCVMGLDVRRQIH
jgi:transposase